MSQASESSAPSGRQSPSMSTSTSSSSSRQSRACDWDRCSLQSILSSFRPQSIKQSMMAIEHRRAHLLRTRQISYEDNEVLINACSQLGHTLECFEVLRKDVKKLEKAQQPCTALKGNVSSLLDIFECQETAGRDLADMVPMIPDPVWNTSEFIDAAREFPSVGEFWVTVCGDASTNIKGDSGFRWWPFS